jgi:hypothetical protein
MVGFLTGIEDFEALTPTKMQKPLVMLASAMYVHAVRIIESSGKDLAPLIHMLTPRGDSVALLSDVFTPENERYKGQILRDLLQDHNASLYVLLSESWTLPEHVRAQYRDLKDVPLPVSEHPQRVSCVSISGENRQGDTIMGVWIIDDTYKPRKLARKADALFLLGWKDSILGAGGDLTGLFR